MGRADERRSDPDDPAGRPAGNRIRPRHHAPRCTGHERGDDGGLPQIHRQPPPDPDRPERRIPGRQQPVPMDERNHGPEEGEELLRDPCDRVSDWWGVELGLIAS